jgi:hypothetical protein
MMMEMCLPKWERRQPRRGDGTAVAMQGGTPVATAQCAPVAAGPRWITAPLFSFFLGPSWCSKGALPLGDGRQGGGNFVALGGASRK